MSIPSGGAPVGEGRRGRVSFVCAAACAGEGGGEPGAAEPPEGLFLKGPEPRGAHKDELGQESGSCRQELARRGTRGRVARRPRGFR